MDHFPKRCAFHPASPAYMPNPARLAYAFHPASHQHTPTVPRPALECQLFLARGAPTGWCRMRGWWCGMDCAAGVGGARLGTVSPKGPGGNVMGCFWWWVLPNGGYSGPRPYDGTIRYEQIVGARRAGCNGSFPKTLRLSSCITCLHAQPRTPRPAPTDHSPKRYAFHPASHQYMPTVPRPVGVCGGARPGRGPCHSGL